MQKYFICHREQLLFNMWVWDCVHMLFSLCHFNFSAAKDELFGCSVSFFFYIPICTRCWKRKNRPQFPVCHCTKCVSQTQMHMHTHIHRVFYRVLPLPLLELGYYNGVVLLFAIYPAYILMEAADAATVADNSVTTNSFMQSHLHSATGCLLNMELRKKGDKSDFYSAACI